MDGILVKISTKSARQLFRGCNTDYIKTVCKGRCCEGTNCISVAIHPLEQANIESLGGVVKDGLLQPDIRGLCPFKSDNGLCLLHGTGNKPLGCIASPFTLNKNNTLIIRNRYRLLRCYKGGSVPAYLAFRTSLEALFPDNVDTLVNKLDNGSDDIDIIMPLKNYQILMDNTHRREKIHG